MPDKNDTSTASLHSARVRLDDAIKKVQATYDALKGRTDEASTRKRAQLNATLEKLRAEKANIAQKLRDADKGSDSAPSDGDGPDSKDDGNDEAEQLRARLKRLTAQQKSRESVVSDQVMALRDKIKEVVGDNDLLKHLIAKERLGMRMKFNARTLKMIDNPAQRRELGNEIRDESRKFAEWGKNFGELMGEVDDHLGDKPDVKAAKEKADAEMEEAKKREAEISDIEGELRDHPDRKDELEKKLADLKGADGPAEADGDEPESVKALRKEIEQLKSDQEVARKNSGAPGKDGTHNKNAVDILQVQIKKKEADLAKLLEK
jgi:hypothetical protein